jgi:hypothetical protein
VTAQLESQRRDEWEYHAGRILESIPVVKYGSRHADTGGNQYVKSVERRSREHIAGTSSESTAQDEIRIIEQERIQPESDCPVCTGHFEESDSVRVLPCSHIYHRDCIDRWLLNFAGTCPLW